MNEKHSKQREYANKIKPIRKNGHLLLVTLLFINHHRSVVFTHTTPQLPDLLSQSLDPRRSAISRTLCSPQALLRIALAALRVSLRVLEGFRAALQLGTCRILFALALALGVELRLDGRV